jgi:hypothetical protein
MSLLGWLGKETPPTTTTTTKAVPMRSLSPLMQRPTYDRIVLGVLGTRSKIRYEEFEDQVMAPMVEAWGIPDEIILPAESDSSMIIQTWAAKRDVPIRLVSCDWIRQGKRAGLLRDSGIQRDATHLILLQGPRSNALSGLAARLSRKGRPVILSERPGEPVKAIELPEKKSTK